jgi:hypothetical protein
MPVFGLGVDNCRRMCKQYVPSHTHITNESCLKESFASWITAWLVSAINAPQATFQNPSIIVPSLITNPEHVAAIMMNANEMLVQIMSPAPV